jgi:hypothetical protein
VRLASDLSTVLRDAAFGYADRCGAWPTIPLGADKRPTIRTGRDHAEAATIDTDVIADWHRRGLMQAIGMPTGAPSGTVVIDVDAKHDGEQLLAVLEHTDVLGPLPRDRVARTRSGGLHVYCAHPGGGIRVRSGATTGQLAKLLGGRPGIDVRGDGGLVVLPPSAGYTWIADGDGDPLPPLPPLWLAAINGAGDPPPRPASPPAAAPDDDQRIRRARAYLARMPAAISGSGGHGALWDAVSAAMVGFDLDVSATRTLIDEYNLRCDPPWSTREIEHKLVQASERCTRPRGYLLGGRA